MCRRIRCFELVLLRNHAFIAGYKDQDTSPESNSFVIIIKGVQVRDGERKISGDIVLGESF
jgi:hypothetical protein